MGLLSNRRWRFNLSFGQSFPAPGAAIKARAMRKDCPSAFDVGCDIVDGAPPSMRLSPRRSSTARRLASPRILRNFAIAASFGSVRCARTP